MTLVFFVRETDLLNYGVLVKIREVLQGLLDFWASSLIWGGCAWGGDLTMR